MTTPDPNVTPVRTALISCFDKTGVAELAAALAADGVRIVSTGSTAATIRDAGVDVVEVADLTGFPECLGGRVKTLHPRVHAGILADRTDADHVAQLDELGIDPIDLVVVNLYPFERTVASGATDAEVIEMIDVGGPTMLRAAAKNHGSVGVVVDPADHARVLAELAEHGGLTSELRRSLATIAFRNTAVYDAAIATWFAQRDEAVADGQEAPDGQATSTPPAFLGLALERSATLRYGENPHQQAALYRLAGARRGVAGARQLGGKELSFNNLLDTHAAWSLVAEFDSPAVVIVKHTNPSGVAIAPTLLEAYERALAGDPVSAFGGIVALNRPVDGATARAITAIFTEVVVAPGYDAEAREVLAGRTNLRVLEHADAARRGPEWQVRSIDGGLLVQTTDAGAEPWDEWRTVSARPLDAALEADLRLAWIVAKHASSNAIVAARDQQVVGVGAGQMSRVDSVRLAVERAGGRQEGAVAASDAFFPFRDAVDSLAAAGIVAVVQPGGSVRDEEVVAAADEHGIAMVLTGRRHFRH
jgi:phosphoribosylaminoimidazolecarboxamide formyltransferase / IMP cyclohydrolase